MTKKSDSNIKANRISPTSSGEVSIRLEEPKRKKCSALSKMFQSLIVESCPITTHKLANKFLSFVVLSVAIWFLVYIIAEREALPGGSYFALLVLLYSGHVFGYLSEKIKLPPLFGKYLS